MSDLVPREQIEQIVGVKRDPGWHYGRAVSNEGMFYILHSQACLDTGLDLRQCPYSLVLSNGGVEEDDWARCLDTPVQMIIEHGSKARLIPFDREQ